METAHDIVLNVWCYNLSYCRPANKDNQILSPHLGGIMDGVA